MATKADTTTKVVANIHMVEQNMASDELFRTEVEVLKVKIIES